MDNEFIIDRLKGEANKRKLGNTKSLRAIADAIAAEARSCPSNVAEQLDLTGRAIWDILKGRRTNPVPDTITFIRNWLNFVGAADTAPPFTPAFFLVAQSAPFCRKQTLDDILKSLASPVIEVVQIEGAGGMGKTTLLSYLQEKLESAVRLAGELTITSYFGFSFSDQGERSGKSERRSGHSEDGSQLAPTGATPALALNSLKAHYRGARWYDTDEEPPLTKLGVELAECHRRHRGIVVLDGVETQLDDTALNQPAPGLAEFLFHLTGLVRDGESNAAGRLVILGTRTSVRRLAEHEGRRVKTVRLKAFSKKQGARFLETFRMNPSERVSGTGAKCRGVRFSPEYTVDRHRRLELLEKIAEQLRSPLALVLFASHLIEKNVCLTGADDEAIESLRELTGCDAEEIARRMTERYDAFFSRRKKYAPCRDVLRQLALFWRPRATLGELGALWSHDIKHLVSRRRNYEDACSELARMGLINDDWTRENGVMVHPIIRVFYREQLRPQKSAWREGHHRLYEHYRSRLRQDGADNPDDILFAIRHAIEAGRLRTAFELLTNESREKGLADAPGKLSDLAAAYRHFFASRRLLHGTDVHGEGLSTAQKFHVLVRAAGYRIATRGMADETAWHAYETAAELAKNLPDDRDCALMKIAALVGSWRYQLVRANINGRDGSLEHINRLEPYRSAAGDNAYEGAVCDAVAFISHFFAGSSSRDAAAGVRATPPPVGERREKMREFPSLYDPFVNTGLFQSWKAWLGDDDDSAQASLQSAVDSAEQIGDYTNIAIAYYCAAALGQFNENVKETRQWAEKLAKLTRGTREVFLTFGAYFLAKWADGFDVFRTGGQFPESSIDEMLKAIQEWRASGAELVVPYFLTVVADALLRNGQSSLDQAKERTEAAGELVAKGMESIREAKRRIDRARRAAERTGEKWWYAETMRVYAICYHQLGERARSLDAVRIGWLAANEQGAIRPRKNIEQLPFFDDAQRQHKFR